MQRAARAEVLAQLRRAANVIPELVSYGVSLGLVKIDIFFLEFIQA